MAVTITATEKIEKEIDVQKVATQIIVSNSNPVEILQGKASIEVVSCGLKPDGTKVDINDHYKRVETIDLVTESFNYKDENGEYTKQMSFTELTRVLAGLVEFVWQK